MDFAKIKELKIHPGIGIARVGNSQTEWFIGPQIPGKTAIPNGGYKDSGDPDNDVLPRVKRQAVLFRIYAYDELGNVLDEVTDDIANIDWAVHLVNKKAEWDNFAGTWGESDALTEKRKPENEWRNAFIEDRQSLIIDPGPKILTHPNQQVEFNGGKFRNVDVSLGTAKTDESGRLLVLGGFGKSGTTNEKNPRITNYANNDFWYDDVSDGPVTAKVKFKEYSDILIEVKPSWVIVAPPDYAPSIQNIVTLYDIAQDAAIKKGIMPKINKPSFREHIYPILNRTMLLQWVQKSALRAHGPNPVHGFDFDDYMKRLSGNSKEKEERQLRTRVFKSLRNPLETDDEKRKYQANSGYMPLLSGDSGSAIVDKPDTWLTITKLQYEIMEKWEKGDFFSDWDTVANNNENVTPAGLDRASLEAACGGAFFPGIEGGWIFRNPEIYNEPYRFNHNLLKPGDITKRMACPWQADFFECNTNWWPAQRPDEVLPFHAYKRIQDIDKKLESLSKDSDQAKSLLLERSALWGKRESWARGLPSEDPAGDEEMIKNWSYLGFVSDHGDDGSQLTLNNEPIFLDKKQKTDKKTQMVETARGKYDHLDMSEYFHILVNIEDYPDFIPTAKKIAIDFLKGANFDADPNYAPFKYTPIALDERLKKIYDDYARNMDKPAWQDSGEFTYSVVVSKKGDNETLEAKTFKVGRFSDRVIKERIRQMAPFNLIDGAWLQNILSTGPCDEVQARLFQIWSDEAGNGETELNHPNVYDQLLKSLSIYMPPITAREFIEQDFLPGAFGAAVFQLAVGLFPQEFFPELLGMTLYLEWEATPTLTPIVKMYQNRHINPQFYSMHVAIDNVTAGHGAMAKEAVKLYLEKKLEEGGKKDLQEHWERIWRGYVTWATISNFGIELSERSLALDRKQIDIASYILNRDPFFYIEEGTDKTDTDYEKKCKEALARSKDNAISFVKKIKLDSTKVATHLHKILLSDQDSHLLKKLLDEFNGVAVSIELRDLLVCILNRSFYNKSLWDSDAFSEVVGLDKNKYVTKLLKLDNIEGAWLVELNRLLLEAAFPEFAKVEPVLFPDYKSYYRNKMIKVIKQKAIIAKHLHKDKELGGVNLMALFENPGSLLDKLAESHWVNKDHPSSSEFYELLKFQGPMYKVFNAEEREILQDWLESLREKDRIMPEDRPQRDLTSMAYVTEDYVSPQLDIHNQKISTINEDVVKKSTFAQYRHLIGVGGVH